MAFDGILATYIVADGVFVLCGALLLTVALISKSSIQSESSVDNIAQFLLLSHCPLNAAIANAALIFVTFVLSIPAIIFRQNRGWLKLHAWLVLLCGVFTLVLGLSIWFETLTTRSMLEKMWIEQTPDIQSLIQQRFNCCGYQNSSSPSFQVDSACPSALIAAQKEGCVGPFSTFANSYLDVIFTSFFGIVGMHAVLILCVAMVLQNRKEHARYKLIDQKNGLNPI